MSRDINGTILLLCVHQGSMQIVTKLFFFVQIWRHLAFALNRIGCATISAGRAILFCGNAAYESMWVFIDQISQHMTHYLFFMLVHLEHKQNVSTQRSKSCILPPTSRSQPVTWRDRPITAVIQLLFKLRGRIWDVGPCGIFKFDVLRLRKIAPFGVVSNITDMFRPMSRIQI